MQLTIMIKGADGTIKAKAIGEGEVRLVYGSRYEEGDSIHLLSDKTGFVVTQLEDTLSEVYAYLKDTFVIPVPFEEKRACFSPKSFTGKRHLLWARAAEPREVNLYRNIALNPIDHHGNIGLFPHASANVETRGETVFAARNAINGNTTSNGHGLWPYESWGINRREDAEIRIDFGRSVLIDKLSVTLRADFPHDNWWKQATVRFSDDTEHVLHFEKSGYPQNFNINPRTVTWLTMSGFIKDETDPSPFPALTQLACWGHDIS